MHLLHLPKIGYTMESARVVGWRVDVGEEFGVGDVVYEIETEKNIVEVEARLPGRIARTVAAEDDVLEVGALVAVVADVGEELSDDQIVSAIRSDGERRAVGSTSGTKTGAAQDTGPDLPERAGCDGPRPSGARIRAMPDARALAKQHGVDLADVLAPGSPGPIRKQDVESFLAAAGRNQSGFGDVGVRERRTRDAVSRSMADLMTASWRTIPQFTQQISVDMLAVREFQAERKASGAPKVGTTAILAAAVAAALVEVPEVNAALDGDELVIFDDVNIALAVDSDRGLLVPVVERLQGLGPADVQRKIDDVLSRVRAGEPVSAARPTIALSNLYGYGIESGVPLVAAPQAAIVFAGDIVERVVVRDGAPVVRPVLGIGIAFDHRLIDGATGGRFSSALRSVLESPQDWVGDPEPG